MSDQAITWGDYWEAAIIGFLLLCVVWPVAKWAFTPPKGGDL